MFNWIVISFFAILFYFVLKMIYNVFIIIIVMQIFARIKAKGAETLKKFNEEKEGE